MAVVSGSRGAVELPGLHPPVKGAQVWREGDIARGAGDFLHVNGRMVDANDVFVFCLTQTRRSSVNSVCKDVVGCRKFFSHFHQVEVIQGATSKSSKTLNSLSRQSWVLARASRGLIVEHQDVVESRVAVSSCEERLLSSELVVDHGSRAVTTRCGVEEHCNGVDLVAPVINIGASSVDVARSRAAIAMVAISSSSTLKPR